MGWGVGMGIGWSTTPGSSGLFLIRSCDGVTANVYLEGGGGEFVPPAKAYLDPERTIPFYPENATIWNLPELINIEGGYNIAPTGEIKVPLKVCPI